MKKQSSTKNNNSSSNNKSTTTKTSAIGRAFQRQASAGSKSTKQSEVGAKKANQHMDTPRDQDADNNGAFDDDDDDAAPVKVCMAGSIQSRGGRGCEIYLHAFVCVCVCLLRCYFSACER